MIILDLEANQLGTMLSQQQLNKGLASAAQNGNFEAVAYPFTAGAQLRDSAVNA